jgi:UPF0271 protein
MTSIVGRAAIDLNADIGESFGRWTLGDDEALMRIVTTVNIACGYHAGDPVTMRRSLVLAKQAGVSAGAHPGYPDLLGFGRRALPATASDTVDYVLYQVGALAALAATEGVRLTHVKPHGALMGAICRDPALAVEIAGQLARLPRPLPLMFAPSAALDAVRAARHPVICENAADLDFDDDGINIVELRPGAKDPATVAAQAELMAAGHAVSASGKRLAMPIDSICVHGDRPNVLAVAAAVRERLASCGYQLRPVVAR